MHDAHSAGPQVSVPSAHTWNIVIVGVLLFGLGFIWLTRVTPEGVDVAPRQARAASTADRAPLPDHPAPDFALLTVGGETVQLSALKGQVVLINVWATWCPPCRAEMPAIEAVSKQYQDEGFVVLAVNMQEDGPTVAAFMDEHRLTFPALLDSDGSVSATYQARVLPSSFFVDRKGVIRAVYRGPMPRSVIAGTVDQLLREAP
jgi:cytochrome c biogenesis protein CcmG, thiol:disulfide interchange protein DsbE